MEAEVCSSPAVKAMSPATSNACTSNAYDVQSEKLCSRALKSSCSSCCPLALRHAPRTLTGWLRDQSARRGAASPLCRATSASYSEVWIQVRSHRGRSWRQHAINAADPEFDTDK